MFSSSTLQISTKLNKFYWNARTAPNLHSSYCYRFSLIESNLYLLQCPKSSYNNWEVNSICSKINVSNILGIMLYILTLQLQLENVLYIGTTYYWFILYTVFYETLSNEFLLPYCKRNVVSNCLQCNLQY